MVKTLKIPQLEINLINKLMQLTGKEMDIFGNVWVLITRYNRHFFSFMI